MLRKAATSGDEVLSSAPMPPSSSAHYVLSSVSRKHGSPTNFSQRLRKLERYGDTKRDRWNPRTLYIIRFLWPFLPLVALVVLAFFSSRNDAWYRANTARNFHRSSTPQLLTVPHVLLSDLSYITMDCHVLTDVRGNLGPASVILNNRTEDWIRDRWQAASDLHGTNIQGPHFVQFTWRQNVSSSRPSTPKLRAASALENPVEPMIVVQRMVLDWEAAYSDNYDVQIRNASTFESMPLSSWQTIFSLRPSPSGPPNATGGSVVVLQWGQSPGVADPTPLHVLHNISVRDGNSAAASQLRILIYTSAMGWGVSLWQVQVYGYFIVPILDDE
jgi:hypothetical protein